MRFPRSTWPWCLPSGLPRDPRRLLLRTGRSPEQLARSCIMHPVLPPKHRVRCGSCVPSERPNLSPSPDPPNQLGPAVPPVCCPPEGQAGPLLRSPDRTASVVRPNSLATTQQWRNRNVKKSENDLASAQFRRDSGSTSGLSPTRGTVSRGPVTVGAAGAVTIACGDAVDGLPVQPRAWHGSHHCLRALGMAGPRHGGSLAWRVLGMAGPAAAIRRDGWTCRRWRPVPTPAFSRERTGPP